MNTFNLSYIILKFPLTLPLQIKNVPARHFECENLIEKSKKRTDKERSICRWAHSQKQVFLKDRGTYWLSGKLISKKSIFQNPDIIFSSYFLNATINYYVLWRKIASKLLNHFPIVQITDQIFPPVPHYCLLKWKSHRVVVLNSATEKEELYEIKKREVLGLKITILTLRSFFMLWA